ncbi:hypothetical protein Bbelb_362180 [Branchiostoma belcheri]|nr:hypothetical protein Bbelb_362180 [Branchiostoma belcheri]
MRGFTSELLNAVTVVPVFDLAYHGVHLIPKASPPLQLSLKFCLPSQSTQATSDQCVSTQYQRGIQALHKHNVTSWRESNAVPSEPSLAKTTLAMLTPVSYLASRLWNDGETTSA